MKTGIFYAVGVGTEPLDLTLRAKQVLETAEVLVTPITRVGEPSAAARIAEQVVSFSGKEIIPLLFPMQKHLDYRERLRGELLQPVRDCLQAGKRVAMVTLGDVSISSTAAYVQQVLEADGYATEVVAGISAFSAGAAKAKCSLCERQESLLVLPGGAAPETIQQALEQFDTLVLMKAGKALPWLVPLLQERQLLDTPRCCKISAWKGNGLERQPQSRLLILLPSSSAIRRTNRERKQKQWFIL